MTVLAAPKRVDFEPLFTRGAHSLRSTSASRRKRCGARKAGLVSNPHGARDWNL